jgi:hypothetical protein
VKARPWYAYHPARASYVATDPSEFAVRRKNHHGGAREITMAALTTQHDF